MTGPPVVSIVGPSGVGKTAFLQALTRELRRRGHRVAYVKHSHHTGLLPDQPGSDTHRLALAGAEATALVGPGLLALRDATGAEVPLPQVVALLAGRADLVLTEGDRSLPTPKLLLHRAGLAPLPEEPARETLAVVGDAPPGWSGPVFAPNDVAAVADLLEGRLLAGRGRRRGR